MINSWLFVLLLAVVFALIAVLALNGLGQYIMLLSLASVPLMMLLIRRTNTRRRIARANRFRFCPRCEYPFRSGAFLRGPRVTCTECGSTFDRQFTRLFWITRFYWPRQRERRLAIPWKIIKRVRTGKSLPDGAFRAP